MIDRRTVIQGLAASLLAASSRRSFAAASPILRVSGEIGAGPESGETAFDAAAFDALPQTRFTTTTPWHDAAVEFSGVSARDLLQAVGQRGPNLQLIALNDYMVEASAEDILKGDGLFATRQDGVVMPVSDKGPIFLVFPFDSRPELKHQSYYSRAVWQLSEIVVTK